MAENSSVQVAVVRLPREGQEVETLIEGHIEVALVEGHAVDRAGLAGPGVLGVKLLNGLGLAHVPKSGQAVSSSAADKSHVVVCADAVDGLVKRLLPCPDTLADASVPEPGVGVVAAGQEGVFGVPVQVQGASSLL